MVSTSSLIVCLPFFFHAPMQAVKAFALQRPSSSSSLVSSSRRCAPPSPPLAPPIHLMRSSSRTSTTRGIRSTTSTLLFLAANPAASMLGSAAGHLLGGNLSVPWVVPAVKTWYKRIPRPTITPPDGIFAPVWTILYACLGVAVARVAAATSSSSIGAGGGAWTAITSQPLQLCWCHYALNLSWAPIFFGLARFRLALVVNWMLTLSVPILIRTYLAVDATAAALLVPYFIWLAFATYLNHAFCRLNPMDGKGYSNALLERDIAKLQRQAAKYADGKS